MDHTGITQTRQQGRNQSRLRLPWSMVSTCLITLLFFGSGHSARAQGGGALAWAKRAGSNSIDEGLAVAVDTAGNVFTTGYFKSTVTFGPGEANETILTAFNQDVFLAKYTTGGNLIWARQAEGFAWGKSIGLDSDGNIYVFGYMSGTITFNPGQTDEIAVTGNGQDVFLAKFDADGKCLWAKYAGGSLSEYGNGLAVDAAGNCYVTGRSGSNPITFGAGEANETVLTKIGGSNGEDIFVAMYNTDGQLQWARNAGGTTGNSGAGIGVDANGNSYVTGSYSGTATFGPGEDNETTLVGPLGGNGEIFVAKFGPDGDLAWVRGGEGQAENDQGNAIAVDASGNSYTTGTYRSKAPFGGQLNQTQLNLGESDDIFIARHDTDGNLQWVKMVVGTGSQYSQGIALDQDGNSYITGYGSSLTFGAEENGEVSLGGVGAQDIFVAKFDPGGLVQWAKLAGGSSDDRGLAVAAGSNGVHVVGHFGSTATFGSGESGQTALTSRGNFDIFVAKFQTGAVSAQPATFVTYNLLPGGNPEMTISGTASTTYTIQRSATIVGPDWNNVGDVTTDEEGNGVFEDTDATLVFPAFYQAVGN